MNLIRLLGIPGLHSRGMRRSRTTIEILHGCSCTFSSTLYHSPPVEIPRCWIIIWILDCANHTFSHQIETQVPEAQPHQLPPHENVPQGRRSQEEGRCVGLNCQTIYTLHYLRVIQYLISSGCIRAYDSPTTYCRRTFALVLSGLI